jgi:murein DD-endopeptidase MepM/ murein hydrolase activator NlpD
MDIRNPMGMPVHASDSGTVVAVWSNNRGGSQILIIGDDGSEYGYAHTGPLVLVGERVKEGQIIGYSNNTGQGITAPHLHYTYKPPCAKKTVDPQHHLRGAATPSLPIMPY